MTVKEGAAFGGFPAAIDIAVGTQEERIGKLRDVWPKDGRRDKNGSLYPCHGQNEVFALLLALALAACTSVPRAPTPVPQAERASTERGREVVFMPLSFRYRLPLWRQNRRPALDCSGMVSYIFRQAANLNISGSAADIAQHAGRWMPRH